ncbi:MAG: glycosyltransferase family A protein [Desulfosporosinus sp.]|nr:glycosyltransferase family A protein [Desulfosporosinus sp.]
MRSIEVLVAAMNQKDAELYYKLGLKSNTVIANQTDSYWYKEYIIEDHSVKVVSTNDRGVGKNRNVALLNASGDICVLGDDDLMYPPNYQEIIRCAFEELPDADIIVFNIVNREIPDQRPITKIKRVGIFNFTRYGAPRIAFKRESLLKANILFSFLFGGGAKYSSGEDTIFLREALKKGLKIYAYPMKIADVIKKISTWFTGYNEKFFFDKGALIATLFPKMKYLAGIYIAIRFKSSSKFTYLQALKHVFKGIKGFREGASYGEWQEKTADCK